MSEINWRKYTTPGAILGILFSTLVIVGLGLFSLQVGKYVWQMASGAPNPFAKTQAELNLSNALARGSLDKTRSARIESAVSNPMLGNPDASLRLVEFLDYECPSSKQALSEVRAFMTHHPDDVLLILRDYPLENDHPNALNAALAARCVFNQGPADRFWAYHDLLFKNQTQLSLFDLRRYAEQVGADLSAYDICLRLRQTESVVRQSLADGAAIGVLGTPTFFFNSFRIPGALDLAAFESVYQKIQAGI